MDSEAPLDAGQDERGWSLKDARLIGVFGDLELDALSPDMRKLVHALLLYKSMFVGPWFTALAVEESAETQATYAQIREDTAMQARRAAKILRRWDAHADTESTKTVTDQVLKRLLGDMLELKKSSTEVFLGSGIGAPTEEMRHEFLELADIDRRHAEILREILSRHRPDDRPEARPAVAGTFQGLRLGPFAPGTLSRTIQESLEQAQAQGHEPTRIVFSEKCLRHLRDEGAVEPRQGDIFGIPVDIDFSWKDECYAITSRDRLSLAEIVTEMGTTHDG